ncbi:hypothetical protein M513_02604, partial [Trichuris suis]
KTIIWSKATLVKAATNIESSRIVCAPTWTLTHEAIFAVSMKQATAIPMNDCATRSVVSNRFLWTDNDEDDDDAALRSSSSGSSINGGTTKQISIPTLPPRNDVMLSRFETPIARAPMNGSKFPFLTIWHNNSLTDQQTEQKSQQKC